MKEKRQLSRKKRIATVMIALGGLIAVVQLMPVRLSVGLSESGLIRYRLSRFSRWLPLPGDSEDINAYHFTQFDTNYRYVCAKVKTEPNLRDVAHTAFDGFPENLKAVPIEISSADVTAESFDSLFGGRTATPDADRPRRPDWWEPEYQKSEKLALCWAPDMYGKGVLCIFDKKAMRLWLFQWSQQWLDTPRVADAFTPEIETGNRESSTPSPHTTKRAGPNPAVH